jgi:hypothetical protein
VKGDPQLTVVLLAAGLGSRYGGLKQFDPLGPHGATLLDYSLFDARRAGFGRVVFVIRPEMAELFDRGAGARYSKWFEVFTVHQRVEDVPAGHSIPPARTRPWGTAQAVLAARDQLAGSFAVMNADDCYGREAIEIVAGFLRSTGSGADRHAVAGFRLDRTLSPFGGVNRAVLDTAADGTLLRAMEVADISPTTTGGFPGSRAGLLRLSVDTLVSMNLWALRPTILGPLAAAFDRFLARGPGEHAECHLPQAVEEVVGRGEAVIEVLPTSSRWCGVTYAEDRAWVVAALSEQIRRGEYPERLWE